MQGIAGILEKPINKAIALVETKDLMARSALASRPLSAFSLPSRGKTDR